jgi:hypothetical protein
MQILYGNPNNYYRTRWGDVDITDREVASGNMGKTWNAATDNFAESNAKALAHGWTSGEDTEHGGGKRPELLNNGKQSKKCMKGASAYVACMIELENEKCSHSRRVRSL